jgi:hypothetical protein
MILSDSCAWPASINARTAAMLNPHQRRRLLVADRSRDACVITAAVTEVLAANPDADPFDVGQ